LNPDLPPGASAAIEALVALAVGDPHSPVSPRSAERAREVHVADSLTALEFVELSDEADRIADLGAGAGFPGLVLAAALPEARVDSIESVGRKCRYLRRAIDAAGLSNAAVICSRAEDWAAGEGREAYDTVTARAVGRLATLAELASPLLRDGGALLAWKGRRNPEEEAELERAAPRAAMQYLDVRTVVPYPRSRDRHIHLLRKNGRTPEGLPRRPGMAAKRPFGSE
jgi:16S rRNA (guanine527-N7)-methyltransferase